MLLANLFAFALGLTSTAIAAPQPVLTELPAGRDTDLCYGRCTSAEVCQKVQDPLLGLWRWQCVKLSGRSDDLHERQYTCLECAPGQLCVPIKNNDPLGMYHYECQNP